jgi:RNA polymerase sigma-70 factor (ECF subfamily)
MPSESALKRPALVPETDEVLVERAAAGDPRAFAQLYRRHARYLAGVVFRLMGDSSELDDVLQETFLICLSTLGKLERAERLRPWLVTIAVRRVQRRFSARARRRWLSGQLSLVSAQSSDPHVSREVRELYRVLEGLSPKLRLPWTLTRIEGDRLEDVAKYCDISLATLKRRLIRADEYVNRRLGHG